MADNGFVLAVVRDQARWRVDRLPDGFQADLDTLISVLHQEPSDAGVIGLVDIADEFFVAIRAVPAGGVRLLLSDVTAAAEWDLARQVLDRLGEAPPEDEELNDVWPAGDLGIFADLGVGELELGAILDDLDLYADEMLLDIARLIGFADAFKAAIDTAAR